MEKTTTYYRLITSFLGETPNSFSYETFETYEEAAQHYEKEYKSRNKGDGHDQRWNNTPLAVQKVTETIISTNKEQSLL